MRYGSVCSGIEAATLAWRPLGWHAAWFAETEAFPSAVLAHHYPEVRNFGDFTKIALAEPVDVLAGGTPCQSFSVAGKRGGLGDPRGVLAFEFLKLAERLRPRWVVFENVPGLLSDDGGRSFGAFLGALGECGYGFAYRVFDAQYFGLAQRRNRVFVVGHLGDWRRAAAVLFERESLSGNPAPSREARQDVAPSLAARTRGGGGLGTDFDCDGELIADTLTVHYSKGGATAGKDSTLRNHVVTHSLRADGFDASEDGTGRGTPLVAAPIGQRMRGQDDACADNLQIVPILEAGKRCGTKGDKRDGLGIGEPGDPMFTLQSGAQHAVVIPIDMRQASRGATMTNNRQSGSSGGAPGTGIGQPGDPAPTLGDSHVPAIVRESVRRLTPRECERLQGFPDDYTLVPYRGKPATDSPRYKALGNSMAVPVMRWIGERIEKVEIAG